MRRLNSVLTPEFSFAGFNFPKHVWTLPRGSILDRLRERKSASGVGDSYHSPTPNQNQIWGFYLGDTLAMGMRWAWCDDVRRSIRHHGWYCDAFYDHTIRGIVVSLPHRRGYLAGYSMGEGMISSLDPRIYSDEEDAALAANSLAERAAEAEWEYQRAEAEAERE